MAKKRKLTPAAAAPVPVPVPVPVKEEVIVEEEEFVYEEVEVDDDSATADAPDTAADAPVAAAADDETDLPVAADAEMKEEEETQNPDPKPDDDDDVVDNDPATVLNLLEPLPKDQISELLRDAAVKHPDVLEAIIAAADVDPSHRKIFVHGLGWDTTTEDLKSAFSAYGEIEDCKAVVDKATGKSKGYGFVLFKRRGGAKKALKEPQKKISNRMTSCQLASAGPAPVAAPPVSEYTQRKIFVSNVAAELDPNKVMQYFAKFGEIEEGPLGLDKATGKFKGFCLFVYRTVEGAKKALEEPHKNYEGQVLHCQKAIDGPKSSKPGFQFQPGSSHFPPAVAGGSQTSHYARNGAGGGGHLMAPSPTGFGYNPGPPPASGLAGLNPAIGQALTTLFSAPGAGLGLTNLLGALNQGGPSASMQGGYGTQEGYGAPPSVQGGYGNRPGWQGGAGRGRPPYGR